MNDFDWRTLENLRMARLQALVKAGGMPLVSVMRLDVELHLICGSQDEWAAMEPHLPWLREQAYLVMGAEELRIWISGESESIEVFSGATVEPWMAEELQRPGESVLQSVVDVILAEDEPMATAAATLEKPTTQTASQTSISTNGALPGQSLGAIAEDVEQSLDTVRDWFLGQGLMIIPFSGQEIVRGEDAIAAYQFFEPLVIRQRMAKRGLPLPGPGAGGHGNGNATANGTAKAATTAAKKPTTTKTTTSKKKPPAKKPTAKS